MSSKLYRIDYTYMLSDDTLVHAWALCYSMDAVKSVLSDISNSRNLLEFSFCESPVES